MSVVFIVAEKCNGCYACVRNCPLKAIRVKEGVAEIMEERCVECGDCINICAAGAIQVKDDMDLVRQLLGRHTPVIAILSSAFPAAFPQLWPGQMVAALRKLGFSEVMETAFGAELVCREYGRLVREVEEKPFLSSTCPAVVSFIEKVHPELLGNLAPIVSPMVAMGRVIKWQYNPEAKVVFIGPCVAKKAESEDEKVAGVIDAVLTFPEIKEMLTAKEIDPVSEEKEEFTGPMPYLGRLFSIPGGLLKIAGITEDILLSNVIVTEGIDRTISCIQEFAQGKIRAKLMDIFFCQGCIGGPSMDKNISLCGRKGIITDYTLMEADPARTESEIEKYAGIDLSRKFTNRYTELPTPGEKEIDNILGQINRLKMKDQLNCAACGYNTCRELAIAVCQDLAENEMCWPYLLEKLKTTQDDLIQAEKLTSLGQLAASIAHELNNPLAGVLVYTKLLSKKIAGGTFIKEEGLGQLSKMELEVNRCSRIIRNLLDFARQTEPMLRLVDVNQVWEQTLLLVSHHAQLQNIEIIRDFSPSLPKVMADFDQLQQVFTNLSLNAIQAMPDGGKLTLRTSVVNNHLIINVQDTGHGIPKDNMSKLFTPFFTTKEKGEGVGLGLAVVHGIIERHKGKIKVHSEVGKGTTFSVHLGVFDNEKD
ncbi:MAG: [Fe-Fe] hydrogenase large subunit C-terminal domain-containing protein [Chloroflexota bacterium]|nr:[Fe-Fe] hydrogenase large subunit C-terminal domain-containing protein [Chloroflexota bacterium]